MLMELGMNEAERLSVELAAKIRSGAPIPVMEQAELSEPALAYRKERVVEQARSGEPLVRLDSEAVATYSYYACDDHQNPPYYRQLAGSFQHVWCRQGVAQKLKAVNQALSQFKVELLVLDGYRTLACQQELWSRYIKIGRELYPNYSEEQLRQYAQEISPQPAPIDKTDPATWPTHATGGAVDLTLRAQSGAPVYMGGVFDDPSWVSHTSAYETLATRIPKPEDAVSASHQEARDKRRLLYWAMTLAGFTNIPSEWWHYDWGNQQWHFRRRKAGATPEMQAWYGFIDPPPATQLPGQSN
jgi:zinc D-Ala-D-Ala dipeptidase